MKTDAYISPDRKFRYWLLRVWDDKLPILGTIGVNPSTADEKQDDPTIRKEIGFGIRLGFGGLLKVNVGAYRETDPKKWAKAADPFGPENTVDHLIGYFQKFNVGYPIAAWGRSIGPFKWRGELIQQYIPNLRCFGRNADGTPRHTLMLPYTTQLEPFTYEARK